MDIPRDTGAIIVYLLLAVFMAFVWYGSVKAQRAGALNRSVRGVREVSLEEGQGNGA